MHDPMTVAFEIKSPFKRRSKFWPRGYRKTLLTIWHVDPCRGPGGHDTCGWFIRGCHADQKKLDLITKRFEEDFDRTWKADSGEVYYFGFFSPVPGGLPLMSSHAIALNLFMLACNVHFAVDGRTNWKKSRKWMQAHLFDVLHFAENPTDSLHDEFIRKFEIGCNEPYTERVRRERIRGLASCIYSYILRCERPWYKHPRWHIRHWQIQWHFWQKLRRWLQERCCNCGKRIGFKDIPVRDSRGLCCSKCIRAGEVKL